MSLHGWPVNASSFLQSLIFPVFPILVTGIIPNTVGNSGQQSWTIFSFPLPSLLCPVSCQVLLLLSQQCLLYLYAFLSRLLLLYVMLSFLFWRSTKACSRLVYHSAYSLLTKPLEQSSCVIKHATFTEAISLLFSGVGGTVPLFPDALIKMFFIV